MTNKHLLFRGLNCPLMLENSTFNTIIIENHDLFYKVCADLISDNFDSKFVQLFVDDQPALFSSTMDFIYDIFGLDVNDRKNQGALYKQLNSLMNRSKNNCEQISEYIIQNINQLLFDYELPLEYGEDIANQDYLKLLNVKIKINSDNLIDKIVQYMDVIHHLRNINIFVFANLNNYMTQRDIERLLIESNYKKFCLVMLENNLIRDRIKEENIFIIDKDLCCII